MLVKNSSFKQSCGFPKHFLTPDTDFSNIINTATVILSTTVVANWLLVVASCSNCSSQLNINTWLKKSFLDSIYQPRIARLKHEKQKEIFVCLKFNEIG